MDEQFKYLMAKVLRSLIEMVQSQSTYQDSEGEEYNNDDVLDLKDACASLIDYLAEDVIRTERKAP